MPNSLLTERPKRARLQLSPLEMNRNDVPPSGIRKYGFNPTVAGTNTSGDERLSDPMVRYAGQISKRFKLPAAKAPKTQGLREMRTINLGDLKGPVPIEIRDPHDSAPAKARADVGGRREQGDILSRPRIPIDLDARPAPLMRSDDNDLGGLVPGQIDKAGIRILENTRLSGQNQIAKGAQRPLVAQKYRLRFDSIPQNSMPITLRRTNING